MKISCKIDKGSKTKLFAVEGELDVHHVKTLRSELMDSIESDAWQYTLDMAKVTYLDSSGLGILVYLKKEIARTQGSLKLLNLQEQVRNVFKLTKLDEFFNLS